MSSPFLPWLSFASRLLRPFNPQLDRLRRVRNALEQLRPLWQLNDRVYQTTSETITLYVK
jgi:hypothetical protein